MVMFEFAKKWGGGPSTPPPGSDAYMAFVYYNLSSQNHKQSGTKQAYTLV